jgi:hypothetical protein
MAAPAAATMATAAVAATALGIGNTRHDGQGQRGQKGDARDRRPPVRSAHRDQSHPKYSFATPRRSAQRIQAGGSRLADPAGDPCPSICHLTGAVLIKIDPN